MGIRSELFLIAHYRKAKEELVKHITRLIENIYRNEGSLEEELPAELP